MSEKCDCGHRDNKPNTCEECDQTFCAECWAEHSVAVELNPITAEPIVVKVREVYLWNCPACDGEREAKVIVGTYDADDLTDAQQNALREQLGLDSWQELPDEPVGDLVNFPHVVTCETCQKSYITELPPSFKSLDDTDVEDDEDFDSEL